jgi:hypothetical protein
MENPAFARWFARAHVPSERVPPFTNCFASAVSLFESARFMATSPPEKRNDREDWSVKIMLEIILIIFLLFLENVVY